MCILKYREHERKVSENLIFMYFLLVEKQLATKMLIDQEIIKLYNTL